MTPSCVCDWSDHCPVHHDEPHRSPKPVTSPTHTLKSWIGLFEPIRAGLKPYDLRVLDRDYKVGDTCLLREYDPLKRAYTGREVTVEITWITSSSGQDTHQACAFSPIALHPASGVLGYKLITAP